MKKIKLLTGLFLLALFFLAGCKKDKVNRSGVFVSTSAMQDLQLTALNTISGKAEGDADLAGSELITERGFCWATTAKPTTEGSKVTAGTSTGNFTANLTDLTYADIYYVRAYAISNGKTYYGNDVKFLASVPIELIKNGDFSTPATGVSHVGDFTDWKTDETDNTIIGGDNRAYKGHSGFAWTWDWAKGFYQTVGDVPSREADYQISFDYTCTWNAWGDYKPVTSVIFSAYSGSDPTNRTVIGKVDITDTHFFPGWDLNIWETRTGTFTLTAAQGAVAAGKKLVIEFDLVPFDGGTFWSDVWYNFDNVSVIQTLK
jgi:hypothetical protein